MADNTKIIELLAVSNDYKLKTKEHCFVAFRLMACTTFSLNVQLRTEFLMHLFVMWTVNKNEETLCLCKCR
jgi:hypothetical protein